MINTAKFPHKRPILEKLCNDRIEAFHKCSLDLKLEQLEK